MATNENMVKVVKLLKNLLTDGKDWANLTINGLTVQKLPAKLNKNGDIIKPATLALVFNPTIDGLQARKGKYFHNKSGFIGYLKAIEKDADLGTMLLTLMEKVNPNGGTITKTVKSDFVFEL